MRFLQLARQLSMEPLVEVNNEAEMECALRVGARVIGINNRNLHDFTVDMDTTTRLIGERASQLHDVIFAALSGISERSDVEYFQRAGARAILVGEALMRAPDPKAKIKVTLVWNFFLLNSKLLTDSSYRNCKDRNIHW